VCLQLTLASLLHNGLLAYASAMANFFDLVLEIAKVGLMPTEIILELA
jgi:hypothetical protein